MIKDTVEFELTDLTEKDTERLGNRLSARLKGGEFIALFGDLGAGKTTLTRAIAKGLGIESVQSPTFTIVREHRGKTLELLHFDAYRLSDEDELYAIGYDDYLARTSVIIMEWCDNVLGALPDERLEIHIVGSGAQARTMQFIAIGKKYAELIGGLK